MIKFVDFSHRASGNSNKKNIQFLNLPFYAIINTLGNPRVFTEIKTNS